jgi:ribosomal protein S18 acetylase RimI-like enzyme
MNDALLTNPIWNALCTEHAAIAQGDDCARRYPHEIGPLAGIRDQSEECYASLRRLAGDYPVVLFSLDPIRTPPGWNQLRDGSVVQMIRTSRPDSNLASRSLGTALPSRMRGEDDPPMRLLTPADAPAMVALAELTEPGPFRLRTLELGNFYGIFHGDELVSMAGKRMHLPGFIEVSGVCTHPDARGRGYARRLMQIVMDEIESAGSTPFLHAWAGNPACRLYETLGFRLSREFHLGVLRNIS